MPTELPAGGNPPAELPGGDYPRPHPPPPSHPSDEEIIETIIDLEREAVRAHTQHSATDYNTFLAPQAKSVSSKGVVSDARTTNTADWTTWRSPKLTDISVICVTHDVAIIHYRLDVDSYYRPGWPAKQIRSSTWNRVGREWKMVFHQVTNIKK